MVYEDQRFYYFLNSSILYPLCIISVYNSVYCYIHNTWQISLSKLSDVLTCFTCGNAIGNFWSTCFDVNILIHVPSVDGIENNPLLKALGTIFLSA